MRVYRRSPPPATNFDLNEVSLAKSPDERRGSRMSDSSTDTMPWISVALLSALLRSEGRGFAVGPPTAVGLTRGR
jgi:hypothetical protein